MKFGRAFARNSLKRLGERVSPSVRNVINYVLSEMEYVPQGWYPIDGWNDPGIAEAQEKHWPNILSNLQGPGPLGVSHLPGDTSRQQRAAHNAMMSYGYVLARAARHKDRLTILDWGAGPGHYYLYSKALLPELEIEYESCDLPNLCRIARKLQPEIRAYDNETDLLGKQYDLVLSSSSLHYVEDWRGQLRKLAALSREYLYVARLQSVVVAPSFVALHKVYRDGYPEFLSWCINRNEFVACAEECGLELLREFVFVEPWTVRGAPEKPESRGFLLRRVRE
jgi:putative methyltransferase (TIGR04325 family)